MTRKASIELPDPVIVWEMGYDIEPARWTARAVVGDVAIFERTYLEVDWDTWKPGDNDLIENADDARDRAANELGAKLKELLS